MEKAKMDYSFSLEEMKQAFKAGQETIWEDLEQTTRCAKFESFEMWFENFALRFRAGWKELQIEKPLKETEYLLYCKIFKDVFVQEGNTQNFYEVGYWNGNKFNTAYGRDGDDLKESEIKFWSELPCPPACR